MSSPPPSTHQRSLTLLGVLSETKRIVTADFRHFLALSVLFLLPVSFSVAIYPILFRPSSSSPSNQSPFNSSSNPQLIYQLLYGLCMFLFSLFASVSITNSTFHGFSGRPVKILSSLKSILSSFFPLIATIISVQFLILLVSIAFVLCIFSVLALLVPFGIEPTISYKSPAFILYALFMSCLFVCALVYLQIMWYFVHVVVVVESKWGFEALKRSAYLVKGMRSVVFLMMILFGVLVGVLSMMCSVMTPNVDESSGEWVGWPFVVKTVVYLGFMTILMLYKVAANTVLFIYCKALHGELALDIVGEFPGEYESLPFDDGKVPDVV